MFENTFSKNEFSSLFQVVIPGLHLTLGIFLKLFNLFDQECRRIDYIIKHEKDDDEEIEGLLNELFFQEGKIHHFRESLETCTDAHLSQIGMLDDGETEKIGILETAFEVHKQKVEKKIEELVSFNDPQNKPSY